ncbi:hypothetical protein OAF54_01840 [bacterium]|nr:hypothetical protein [bacterium]
MSDEQDNTKHSTFGVAIDPEFVDNKWTGNVSAFVEEDLQGDLSKDEVFQIRSVCGMIAASLQLMAEDPAFLEYVKEYFSKNMSNMVEDEYEIELEENQKSPNFSRSEDGKVITLDFNTKTHGSA